jgi:hypothetical protein
LDSVHKETFTMSWKTIVLIGTLAIAPSAAAQVVTPPAVPENLQVTDGSIAFLVGHAVGTQNYVCVPTSSGHMWTFFGPQATLFDDNGDQITTHFLSPNPDENGAPRATWQHSGDTSAAWAAAIANSTDPSFVAPGAIPWLLLRVVGTEYGPALGATLTATTFIQRVNTAGGLAPDTGCKSAKDTGKKALVPYTADYVFYR